MITAAPCVSADRLILQPDGQYTMRVGDAVLSIQPDGTFQTRPLGTAGPWEKGPRVGNKIVLSDPAYPTGSYAVLVA